MSDLLRNLSTRNVKLDFVFKLYYLILLLLTLSVLISLVFSSNIYNKTIVNSVPKTESIVDGNKNLSENLYNVKLFDNTYYVDQFDIDKIRKTKLVPNIVVPVLPAELKDVKSVEIRKEIFIQIALPLIVKENEVLHRLNRQIKHIEANFSHLSRKDALWIKNLMDEYGEYSINQLLLKIDVIPVSLALAQAVIESGWGTSRFAYEGNALYGQYVWDNGSAGIIPNDREVDANYKIKSFNNLRESVASYMKNLNTNYHYDEFRINRFVMRTNKIPLDGANLADYLYNYSIEDDYPIKIKNIIEMNNFQDFENLRIDTKSLIKETVDII